VDWTANPALGLLQALKDAVKGYVDGLGSEAPPHTQHPAAGIGGLRAAPFASTATSTAAIAIPSGDNLLEWFKTSFEMFVTGGSFEYAATMLAKDSAGDDEWNSTLQSCYLGQVLSNSALMDALKAAVKGHVSAKGGKEERSSQAQAHQPMDIGLSTTAP